MAQRPGKGFDGVEMHHMEEAGTSPGSPGALSHHALQQSNAGAGHTAYSQEGTHNEPHSTPHHHVPPMHRNMKVFVVFILLWEAMIIILLAIFSTYGETADAKHTDEVTAHIAASHARKFAGANEEASGEVTALEPNMISTSFYAFLQDVHVMIFIGFGFLMTFLKRYGYSAVGITLLVSAMVIQWHMLVNPFWENIINEPKGHAWTKKIQVDAHLWLVSDFCAGAAMITFGGLLGKISPIQMALLAALETVIYSLNENIGIKLGVADIGGTTVIHMFGAYFGMSATRVLSDKIRQGGHKMNGATYTSDIFAMIGTVYLWMFWPSFNGAPAVTPTQQHRAVLNTLLSLTGSTMAAFMTSTLFRHDHRFNMVDVQNATIAGGVVMGGCADLYVGPAWAVLIGFGAGFLSVTGYCFITPFLENKLGFLDTCGINNLHGMPSILGAILAAIYAAAAKYSEYGSDLGAIYFKRGAEGTERTASYQAGMQLLFIAITLGISIVGGAICAFIVKIPIFAGPGNAFDDSDFWETPEEEPPMLSAGNLKTSTGATVEDRLRQLERELRQLQNA